MNNVLGESQSSFLCNIIQDVQCSGKIFILLLVILNRDAFSVNLSYLF